MISRIKCDISEFLDYIIGKGNISIDKKKYMSKLKIVTHTRRCLGRIWDAIYKYSDYNINKQCSNKAYRANLCYSCLYKKNKSGLVNKYPTDSNILEYYSKCLTRLAKTNDKYKNRNVYDELNLNIYQKYIVNKKILNNNKMDKIKYSNPIDNKNSQNNREHKSNIKPRTSLYSDWWKSRFTDKVEIYDELYSTRYIYAMEETNKGYLLLNKNQVQLGKFEVWVDSNNTIPDCYKNSDNEVLNPLTCIPLYEFILNKTNKFYNSLHPSLYREYRYDTNKEELVYTNSIKFII